jgi:hypothetical protein
MIGDPAKRERVSDLMSRRQIDLSSLEQSTGLQRRIVEAIACQRYTPSPGQREQVSGVLGVDRERIIWGHATVVDQQIHQPI